MRLARGRAGVKISVLRNAEIPRESGRQQDSALHCSPQRKSLKAVS